MGVHPLPGRADSLHVRARGFQEERPVATPPSAGLCHFDCSTAPLIARRLEEHRARVLHAASALGRGLCRAHLSVGARCETRLQRNREPLCTARLD